MGGADGAQYLSVATIRKPHGVRGELVVALDTDRPGAVFRVGRVLLLGDPTGRPLARRLTIQRARPFQDGMLLKVAEFEQRNAEVEALRGHTLLIPAGEAAPVAAGEIHYRDLVGMKVLDRDRLVGTVRHVVEIAGGELLAVQRPGRKELLIPFVQEWVRGADPVAGELRLELPEGLLEL